MPSVAKVRLKVVPAASADEIVGWLGDTLKVRVTARPEKGRANDAVIALIASRLGIPKQQIRIKSGHTSSNKLILIDGVAAEQVQTAFSRS